MVMRRFRVVEDSMLPTLRPGDEFVASSSLQPVVGAIVAVPKPGTDDFWLVKRVSPRSDLPRGQLWLVSDNDNASPVDSRTFGAVSADSALTKVERLDATRFAEASEMLGAEDAALGRILSEYGHPSFWTRPPEFSTLVLLILEQQVSLESGAAVYRRFRESLGAVAPEQVARAGSNRLRELGATRQKAGYIAGLAREVIEGDLDLGSLYRADIDLARRRLLDVPGIGPWTADAFLLSALLHPDVFPIGDRALQVGVAEILGMAAPPTPAELEVLGDAWRPVRAVAARLIWHAYLTLRGRSEPEVVL